MVFYHGTTKETLRSILRNGLRKGTFLSPDREVAEHFAKERSEWNNQEKIILEVKNPQVSEVKYDRHNRRECILTLPYVIQGVP